MTSKVPWEYFYRAWKLFWYCLTHLCRNCAEWIMSGSVRLRCCVPNSGSGSGHRCILFLWRRSIVSGLSGFHPAKWGHCRFRRWFCFGQCSVSDNCRRCRSLSNCRVVREACKHRIRPNQGCWCIRFCLSVSLFLLVFCIPLHKKYLWRKRLPDFLWIRSIATGPIWLWNDKYQVQKR